MRVARYKDVDVKLPPHRGKCLLFSPRNDLVTVAEANLELPNGYHLLLVKRLFVQVAFHHVHIGAHRL